MRSAIALAASLAIFGCGSLAPQPEDTVAPQLPAAFDPPLAASEVSPRHWWTLFEDPVLDRLVAVALAANHDVRTAAARIREARALADGATAGTMPTASLTGAFARDRQSDHDRSGALPLNPVTPRRAAFDASWELDLFGALARRADAAGAEVEAAAARSGAVAVSVAGEVAATYVELRTAQALQATLRDLVAAARDIEQLVVSREKVGLVTTLDVLRAREQVAATEAQRPVVRAREDLAARRLGVLVGASSQSLLAVLATAKALPSSVPALPGAIPASLLERRPDLVAAERHWRAATLRVAGARADRLPTVSLGATLGLLSIAGGNFADAPSRLWLLGAALRAPLYAPELDAALEVERARAELAAIAYEQAAAAAVLEVEAAVVRLSRAREREDALSVALAADQEALGLARVRYERGLIDFLGVLDVVRQRTSIEQQWIEARAGTFAQFVALHKALGGGFSPASGERLRPSHEASVR